MKSYANIRKDYGKFIFDEKHIKDNPFDQFSEWIDFAISSAIDEPTAMVLSTVSAKGFPSSRVVLFKELMAGGFVFYTHYESRKGRHLTENPNASLLFFWKELERQIRIEGSVSKIADDLSDTYFYSRPIESQLSAIVSPQSTKIPDRDYLENLKRDYVRSKAPVMRPPNWGGYVLKPVYVEFWQGRENRLHDRFMYCSKKNKTWEISRLAP